MPSTYTFWDLHVAIQDAMGWLDCHLHLFHVVDRKTGQTDLIGIPDEDAFEDDEPHLPGWHIPITDYFQMVGDRARYEYDFGDDWQHEIVLEAIAPRETGRRYPVCLDGARRCPPEDCGGVTGYDRMLKALADPSDEEHDSYVEWTGGGYDPGKFDPKAVRFDSPTKRWRQAFGEE